MCTLFASFSLHEYIDVSKTNVMMLILLLNVTLLMLLCPYRIIRIIETVITNDEDLYFGSSDFYMSKWVSPTPEMVDLPDTSPGIPISSIR